ncbi:hydroxyacid dehydrogenase [Muricoccus radiodurans]|uniref:hydroxyacid dehydrogenase n=1 Tax=Muricoccus radiodurans TaxID=2231721 RepID=UPI003CEF5E15
MPTCLIVQPVHPAGLDRLRAGGVEPRMATSPDMASVAREIVGCEAVITRNAGLDTAAIDAATSLRIIANHGVGTNKIDLRRADALNIPVLFTPTANARSVAEQVFALALAAARRVVQADAAVRRGDWSMRYDPGMAELHGKTLGLVGFGTIGRLTAAIGRHGFGMRLLVWSPRAEDAALAEAGAARADSLDALLDAADVVSLHRPLRGDTRHTIGAAQIARMRPHAILVNTARGELVDTAALAAALRDGRIAGAGVDVFAAEPPPADEPLLAEPRAVLAPHLGGATDDALRETALQCADGILEVLAGRPPAHLVQPEVWDRRRAA